MIKRRIIEEISSDDADGRDRVPLRVPDDVLEQSRLPGPPRSREPRSPDRGRMSCFF